jgi:hypothetical protein
MLFVSRSNSRKESLLELPVGEVWMLSIVVASTA